MAQLLLYTSFLRERQLPELLRTCIYLAWICGLYTCVFIAVACVYILVHVYTWYTRRGFALQQFSIAYDHAGILWYLDLFPAYV